MAGAKCPLRVILLFAGVAEASVVHCQRHSKHEEHLENELYLVNTPALKLAFIWLLLLEGPLWQMTELSVVGVAELLGYLRAGSLAEFS